MGHGCATHGVFVSGMTEDAVSGPQIWGGWGVWKQEGRIKFFSSADLDKTVELLFDCILRLLTNMRSEELARAVGVAVGRRSGGRLATTLVATKNIFIFEVLIEGMMESKNLFSES